MHLALLHAIQVRLRPHVPRLQHTCCCRLDAVAAVTVQQLLRSSNWVMHARCAGSRCCRCGAKHHLPLPAASAPIPAARRGGAAMDRVQQPRHHLLLPVPGNLHAARAPQAAGCG